jgi:hypothetical protein
MSALLEDAHPVIQESHRASPAKTTFRVLMVAVIALVGILIVTLASPPAAKDYISYWSAGKLLIEHADPYAAGGVLALEVTQGYSEARPLIMRNPPWALFLAAPLGYASATAGMALWLLAAVGCILAYLHLMNVAPGNRALAFLFAPALGAIAAGQSSPFLLLGFSLFLRFHRVRPFVAGAALLFLAIKPHLFLVFWVLLLVDCVYQRNFRVPAGGAFALAAGTGFAMWFDPHVWQQYMAMLHFSRIDREFVPTVSVVFRLLIDAKAVWLQLVPSVLGIVWGCWYYARNRHVWDWRRHGLLLMLVTVLVSPYSWPPDEIVLLPALMAALSSSRRRSYSVALMVAVNSIAMLMLLAAQIPLISGAYVWTPAAWLACFLYARRGESGIEPVRLDCRGPGSVLVASAGVILGTLAHARWP